MSSRDARWLAHPETGAAAADEFFDQFEPGQVYKHQPGRTVTEADNLLFTVQ